MIALRYTLSLSIVALCASNLACKLFTQSSSSSTTKDALRHAQEMNALDFNFLFPLPKDKRSLKLLPNLLHCSSKIKIGGFSTRCPRFSNFFKIYSDSLYSHLVSRWVDGRKWMPYYQRTGAIYALNSDPRAWRLVSLSFVPNKGDSAQLRLVFQPLFEVSRANAHFSKRLKIAKAGLDPGMRVFSARDGTVVTPMDIAFGGIRSFGIEPLPSLSPYLSRVMQTPPTRQSIVAEDQSVHLVFTLRDEWLKRTASVLYSLFIQSQSISIDTKLGWVHPLFHKEQVDAKSLSSEQSDATDGIRSLIKRLLNSFPLKHTELLLMTTALTGAGQSWSFSKYTPQEREKGSFVWSAVDVSTYDT